MLFVVYSQEGEGRLKSQEQHYSTNMSQSINLLSYISDFRVERLSTFTKQHIFSKSMIMSKLNLLMMVFLRFLGLSRSKNNSEAIKALSDEL